MKTEFNLEQRLDKIEELLMGQKNVLTFTEACCFAGISKTYMYKLTCGSRIPHYKPNGKNIYFNRTELEQWLLKNRIKPAEEIEQESINYVTLSRKKF